MKKRTKHIDLIDGLAMYKNFTKNCSHLQLVDNRHTPDVSFAAAGKAQSSPHRGVGNTATTRTLRVRIAKERNMVVCCFTSSTSVPRRLPGSAGNTACCTRANKAPCRILHSQHAPSPGACLAGDMRTCHIGSFRVRVRVCYGYASGIARLESRDAFVEQASHT